MSFHLSSLSFILGVSAPSFFPPLPSQIDSYELIRSRELVACSLSTLRASLPSNTVYICQPLQSPTILQQDLTVPSRTLGMFRRAVCFLVENMTAYVIKSGKKSFNKDHYKVKASTASLKITLRVCFRK